MHSCELRRSAKADISEAQLWTDIATATVTLTGYKGSRGSSDQRTAEGMYFSVLARLCNLVPLLTRFVPLDKYWSSHSSELPHVAWPAGKPQQGS